MKETYIDSVETITTSGYVETSFDHSGDKPTEPTTIMSKAIEDVERQGYKVMVAMVDLNDNTTPKTKEERLFTFCDIKSKKLREEVYKEIENGM